MKVSFKVSFELPENATINDAYHYVEDSVASWHGSLRPAESYGDNDPGDPMFNLNSDTVTVEKVI
jgi:hypothetical protein